jgi:hypothetical protein
VPYVVNVTCGCGTSLVVIPPDLLELVPHDAELGIIERISELEDDQGRRFTIADRQGGFRCPVCSERRTFFGEHLAG